MAMAKVVIIDPLGWQGAVSGYGPSPNVGIAYLVPMLRQHGHDVMIMDLNNEAMTEERVLSSIEEYHPDIVGFSVKTATMKSARDLAQQVKKVLPNVPLILGGPHTTLAWQQLVKEPWFDAIFIGEGEEAVPVLCQRLVAGHRVEDIAGVVTRRGFKEGLCVKHPLIASASLNTLPFPDYGLFPQNVRDSLRRHYPLLTSRGCVYDCTFCSVPEISGKGFRRRSPQSLIEELKWARETHGATQFWIVDDVFNLNMKRCKEICRALIDADLAMQWYCPNGLRADRIDQELADLMFQSGCRSVNVGVESADPAVLAAVKKGETIEEIENGIRIFKQGGMSVTGFFIIGLPGDSIQAELRSVEFVKRTGIGAHFNLLVPYPGTELWEWANKQARFLADPEDGIHFRTNPDQIKVVVETDDFPAAERKRAYELVHTKLERFNMLIPSGLSRWQYYGRVLRLLWTHDRARLVSYVVQQLMGGVKTRVRKLLTLPG
jgi:anaerobic magnesium-protoporphyrin IX monomethyl ester cyclase